MQWCVVIVNWCRFFPPQYHCQISIFMIALGYLAYCWICWQRDVLNHTWPERILRSKSNKQRTLQCILISGTHWFPKCNFWKHSLGAFWGRRGRRGQTTLKIKTTKILCQNSSKIDKILNLASATSKMTSEPQQPRRLLTGFYYKLYF